MSDLIQDTGDIVVFLVVLVFLVFVVRSILGTRGLPAKLDQINDRVLLSADAILDAWRAENRRVTDDMKKTLAQHNSAIENEISRLRREISEFRSEDIQWRR